MSARSLIIETDDGWVGYLNRALTQLGLDTKVVERYEDALKELQTGKYVLATLDLSLDQEKRYSWGKTLLATIKSQKLLVPPIVVVSGTGQIEDFVDCINNYRDYVTYFARKGPFDNLSFNNAINQILHGPSVIVGDESAGTVESVSQILRRVPAGLRRWTWEGRSRTGLSGSQRTWCIDNEYHVQNLLWFLLSPIFPDLKDEEYAAGVGTLHPRTDFYVPHLRLVIEVKFWRCGLSLKKVIEEIAADASLYLTEESPYERIVAFVWDDGARSEQHDALTKGLKSITGVVDAVVISRPATMTAA